MRRDRCKVRGRGTSRRKGDEDGAEEGRAGEGGCEAVRGELDIGNGEEKSQRGRSGKQGREEKEGSQSDCRKGHFPK